MEYEISTNTVTGYSSGAGRLFLMTCVSSTFVILPGHTATTPSSHVPPTELHYNS